MDIERLKEHDLYVLRAVVSGLEEEQSIDPVIARQFEKVIDEAIARQSATSEEVADAIKRFEKRNNKLKAVQDNGDAGCVDIETWERYQGFIEDNNLAITALQKIGTNTVDVAWTEAVPYCPKCDADIEDDQKFCKDCGVELIWPYEWDGYITVQEPEH